ncbi:MAG TPA: TauD/TfdA family dioxygenase [Myxococcota bacterium]|nr:TauD/TfdA family dioxygenase [Myxococcota bacterium]
MTLEVMRLAGSLGAEVHGVDAASLDDASFAALHRAFLEHHVLVLRDQKLTPDQQVEFGRRFGTLYVHPIVPHIAGQPEVIEIANRGKQSSLTEVWHSDVSFAERPPLGSALYALEVPAAGGDTLFANQHLAFERLSPGMRRMLEGLRGLHSGARLGSALGQGESWRDHATAHPVVRTHPETGRKALYVNEAFTVAFEDMTRRESAPLLRFLSAFATRPDLTLRHRWKAGDLVIWDNRSVQHHAIHDHGDATRRLHRITIEGDVPR